MPGGSMRRQIHIPGKSPLENESRRKASVTVPEEIQPGQTIHIICEVKDDGAPSLTRYQRVLIRTSL